MAHTHPLSPGAGIELVFAFDEDMAATDRILAVRDARRRYELAMFRAAALQSEYKDAQAECSLAYDALYALEHAR